MTLLYADPCLTILLAVILIAAAAFAAGFLYGRLWATRISK